MLRAILRAVAGGLVAGLLASALAYFLMQPESRALRRGGSAAGFDDLSEEETQQLLRELGAMS